MMSSMPEFIRGNQRSYLRIGCDREELERDYEYHMYTRNDTKLLLRGSFRNLDGEEYLYFDISARQSLDVLLQVKKLNREMAQRLFTDILRLCDETDKYLLNLRKVSFRTRHIMYSQEQNDFRFLYNFSGQGEQWQQDLAQFSEMMVERLDYSDDKLMEVIYRFYEMMTDSQEAVDLRGLAQMVLKAISDKGREGTVSPEAPEGASFDSGHVWGREAGEAGSEIHNGSAWNMDGISAMPPVNPDVQSPDDEKPHPSKKGKKKTGKKKQDADEAANTGDSPVRTKYKKSLLIELIFFPGGGRSFGFFSGTGEYFRDVFADCGGAVWSGHDRQTAVALEEGEEGRPGAGV